MRNGTSRRHPIAASGLLLSGVAGLILEVAWQRAVTGIIGSEARSMSLVLAVFLAGLALGYRYWGGRAARLSSPRALARAAGHVELALGAWALLSPWWITRVRHVALLTPDGFAADALIAAAILAGPAFLMGASLPFLTKALPGSNARAYGLNTLGACVGAWAAGFWLVPEFGLPAAARVAGVLDLLAGLAFLAQARGLSADHAAAATTTATVTDGSRAGLYAAALLSGAASIALEIVVTRLASLTVGPSVFVFPLVLGLFVLGLGLGAVTLTYDLGDAARARARLTSQAAVATVLLTVLSLSIPYWPNWANLFRLEFEGAPGTFAIYWAGLAILGAGLLVPATFFTGRLLPLAFAAASQGADAGRVCGRIYALNALGTVLGACGLGYVAGHWLDLDAIFKAAVALVALAGLAQSHERHRALKAYGAPAVLVLTLAVALALPSWDRASYAVGLFRVRTKSELGTSGFFAKPTRVPTDGLEFYRDGPDATVSVAHVAAVGSSPPSRTLFVNGKPDANTFGDYPTMALIGTLPYLMTAKAEGIRAAVVGVASGVTAGLLARMRDVAHVDAIEISSTVLEALPLFRKDNGAFDQNPKASIIRADALRFFARSSLNAPGRVNAPPYDLIVSEPSNPWVVGNENLFTPEFYQAARSRLAPGGCFAQWFHVYEIDERVLSGILANLAVAFNHADAFLFGTGDVGVIATDGPRVGMPALAVNASRRLREPVVVSAIMRSGVTSADQLAVLHLFDEAYMKWFAQRNPQPAHDLDHPWLAARAAEAHYLGQGIPLRELVRPEALRADLGAPGKSEAFGRLFAAHPTTLPQCLEKRYERQILCRRYEQLARYRATLAESNRDWGWHRLLAYQALRQSGFVEPDRGFLDELRRDTLDRAVGHVSTSELQMKSAVASLVTQEFRREGLAPAH